MQLQPGTSRIELGSHPKRVRRRPAGRTWQTARAGGLPSIHNPKPAQMPPTCELRAACPMSRVEVAGCSSNQARRESASARTMSACRLVRTAGRGRRHVQAGRTRSTMLTKRSCRQLASYAQPAASAVRRMEPDECSSSQARRESSSARTLSASRVVRTAGRGRRHVQAGCTRSNMLTKRSCRQLASYAQPAASAVRRMEAAECSSRQARHELSSAHTVSA